MNLDTEIRKTLDLIKAQTTGVTSSTGLFGIDLAPLISTMPVKHPFIDSLARTRPDVGGQYAIWRVLTDVRGLQQRPSTQLDWAAPVAVSNLINVSSPYAKIGQGYTVTRDAIAQAKGYADAHAEEVRQAFNLYMIGSDRISLGGQAFPLQTPAAPAVATATTGGSIAAGVVVNVKICARTGAGYYYGGSTVPSALGTVTTSTTTTNTVTITPTDVPGGVAYDVWIANGAGTYFYYTTVTTTQPITVTALPTANQAVPATLPGLYQTAPSAIPTVDASGNAADPNGLLATLAGDYATGGATGLVQRGTGTSSGAYFRSMTGNGNSNQFTVSGQNVAELDALNTAIFNQVQLSPTRYLVSAQEANSIAKLIFANAGGGTNYFAGSDRDRNDVVAGGFVGHYINKAAGGVPVPLQVMPNLAPGTLIAVSDAVDFPGSHIGNVLEWRSLDEVADYQYATNRIVGQAGGGPRFDGEVFSTSTLVNRVPTAMGVIQSIAAS